MASDDQMLKADNLTCWRKAFSDNQMLDADNLTHWKSVTLDNQTLGAGNTICCDKPITDIEKLKANK